ncbi:MAG: copper resistance protein CopC, partial [Jatrophihabitantaceae bacterium]
MRRLVLVLLALFGAALALAGPASAHATVEGSTPADGARLARAPASVSVRFSESVGIGYLHVIDRSGHRVETGTPDHPGGNSSAIGVALRAHLPDSTYTVSFRVLSADSHPVAGTVRFVVGNGPIAATAAAAPSTGGGVSATLDAARWVSTVGFALLAGIWLLFVAVPARRGDRRARRLVWTGWTAAAGGALAELLLQGSNAAGAPITSVFRWTLIDSTLHTNFGQWHCARLVLLGIVAVLLGPALRTDRRGVLTEDALVPLGLGIAGSFGAVGHAATTDPRLVSMIADTLHLSAVAVWVGGLAVLCLVVLPRRDAAELVRVLPVFSRVAFTCVAVIAVTGTYAAWLATGSWRALFETTYGLLVVAKVVGFIGLLALGNLSRMVIQRRVRRPVVAYARTAEVEPLPGPPGLAAADVERLRRTVLVEVAIAAVVLALAAVLVGRPRGSDALAAADRAPVTATAAISADRSARVRVDPGRHGIVSVAVD